MMVTDIKIILKDEDSDLVYSSVDSFIKVVNMTEKVTSSLLTEAVGCFDSIQVTSDSLSDIPESTSGASKTSCLSSALTDSSTGDCTESVSCKTTQSNLCLKKHEPFLETFKYNVANPKGSCKKTFQELSQYSRKELQIIIEDLTHTVEEVSSELVQLLLENDALQQESDARNIAIEQLLKLTVVKVSESDLKPIQMSVILPEEEDDEQSEKTDEE